MISIEGLRELYDYNYWARDQQLAVCEKLSEERLSRPLGSSFGSLRDTLKHLPGAEWVWVERFYGRNPRSFPGADGLQSIGGNPRALAKRHIDSGRRSSTSRITAPTTAARSRWRCASLARRRPPSTFLSITTSARFRIFDFGL